MTALVVAVSGGVDSVVLLHKLTRHVKYELVVAHFDHGIRTDSAEDAAFVEQLARSYNVPFEVRREELGADASEELARERRYTFLREVAAKYNGPIVTAHHADDVTESIAINLHRGTGWRGLAVLDSEIVRPLLGFTKQELMTYATTHDLVWHEDSTNASDKYLRNRMRHKLQNMSAEQKVELRILRDAQVALKKQINDEVARLLDTAEGLSRYFFMMIDEKTADELLRAAFVRAVGTAPTRPQRHRALLAAKVARVGTVYQVGAGVELYVDKAAFVIRSAKAEIDLERIA